MLQAHFVSQPIDQLRWVGCVFRHRPENGVLLTVQRGRMAVLYTDFLDEHTPLAAYAAR